MVTTQNPDGQMTHHTTKRAVEDAIIDTNKFKYSQSTDTPPMQPSFVAEFGYTGNTPAAEAVLNGTYVPPPDCDPVLQDFLAHCKRPPGIPTDVCPRHITTTEHSNGWKKAHEHTQAGRSGLTFAMFKANALNPDLAAVDASFQNIGYASGFAFDRWKTGINCMLLKKTNNYLVNKLQTILLLEADSGMNYKKLCRDVMWFAELAGAIPPELGGGRRKHRPIEQVLCSVLLNDLLRQKHKAAAIASSDFEGCFDRIVHAITFICL